MLQVDFQHLERRKANAETLDESIERSEKIVRSMAVQAEGERVETKEEEKRKEGGLRDRQATGVEV